MRAGGCTRRGAKSWSLGATMDARRCARCCLPRHRADAVLWPPSCLCVPVLALLSGRLYSPWRVRLPAACHSGWLCCCCCCCCCSVHSLHTHCADCHKTERSSGASPGYAPRAGQGRQKGHPCARDQNSPLATPLLPATAAGSPARAAPTPRPGRGAAPPSCRAGPASGPACAGAIALPGGAGKPAQGEK